MEDVEFCNTPTVEEEVVEGDNTPPRVPPFPLEGVKGVAARLNALCKPRAANDTPPLPEPVAIADLDTLELLW